MIKADIHGTMWEWNDAKFKRERKEALRQAGDVVIGHAKSHIHNVSGTLAASLKTTIIGGANTRAYVHANTRSAPDGFYARFLERGHRHAIVVGYRRKWAKGKKAGTAGVQSLYDKQGNPRGKSAWTAYTITHCWVAARPFLEPALNESVDEVLAIGKRVIVERAMELKPVGNLK